MRETIATALLLLAAAGTVLAAPAPADDLADAQAFVRGVTGRVRAELAALPEDAAGGAVHRVVERHVLPHVDFRRMSRLVLGKHWRRASPDQRRRFIEGFRALLVRTYAGALAEGREVEIEYLPPRPGRGPGEVEVRTRILQPGGLDIPVDYALYRTPDGRWKVFDVSIDGVSLVGTYRSSFAAEIERRGLEALIRRLAEQAAEEEARAAGAPLTRAGR